MDAATAHAAHGRRRRRALTAPMAVGYQLLHLMELHGLRAIVVADDVGQPIAQAGDRTLTSILADSAMWGAFSARGIDPMTFARIREWYPDILPGQIAAAPIGLGGATVLAVGTGIASHGAVMRARDGILRICRATDGVGPRLFDFDERPAPTTAPAPWREDGVLWFVRRS